MNTLPPDVVCCGAFSHWPSPKSVSHSATERYFGATCGCKALADSYSLAQESLLSTSDWAHSAGLENTSACSGSSPQPAISNVVAGIIKIKAAFLLRFIS